MRLPISLIFSILSAALFSQQKQNLFNFTENTEIKVYHGPDSLLNPWAGGINYGEVNTIDLNNDGKEDVVIFDRAGSRITTYINKGTASNPVYTYAPEFRKSFPEILDWMLLRDYNCDGKKDLFTGRGSVKVYTNISNGGMPDFTLAHSTPFITAMYSGGLTNLFVPITDLPAIYDIDFDGDLDIITFGNQTNYVEWIENKANCGLDFHLSERCWGHFLESNFTNKVFLGSCTPTKFKSMHSGGAITALDLNGDNVIEILLSDISFNNIAALYNSGTKDSAYMYDQDTLFPSYDQPVDLTRFPAGFYEDVTGDGLNDLIFSPHEKLSGSSTHKSMWLYTNIGTASNPVFNLTHKSFLQNTMIEMGEGSVPRLVDLNGDSLMDLILANAAYLTGSGTYKPAYRYYKNSGTSQKPEFTLIDSNFLDISSYNFGRKPIPAFGDVDNDGDMDMIIGDENGNVHLFNNTGNTMTPNYILNTGAGFASIDVGSDAAPFLFDMDRDGDLDLVVGNRRGKIYYYKNSSNTTPSFQLVNDYFGGVDVRGLYSSYGSSVPYVFEKDSIINLVVGSEDGVFQFDSISKVVDLPNQISATIGSGQEISNNNNNSPFGITKRSGRNQMLIRAEELTAQGLVQGYITALSFEVSTGNNPNVRLNVKLKNVAIDSLTSFVDELDSVIVDEFKGLGQGWSRLEFNYPFLWDGKSNLVVEVCFDGNIPNNLIKVKMDHTPYKSHAWGDITNYNVYGVNGCTMPYLESSKIRPNLKFEQTPAFAKTDMIFRDGTRNAAAFHDMDNDGFVDAFLGNFAGGVGYYKGKIYDISIDEPRIVANNKLNVYPNPGQGNFNVITENTSQAVLRVFDLKGSLIREVEVNESETKVDLSGNSPGLYLFILQEKDNFKSQKVIVE